jgi:hypothetical protein
MNGRVRTATFLWLTLCGAAAGAIVLTTRPWSGGSSTLSRSRAPLNYAPAENASADSRGKILRAGDAAPRPDGYLGSHVCAECHAEIFQQYASTPMGQSLAAVDDAMPVEGDPSAVVEPPGNRIYKVGRDEGGVFHSEITLDEEGLPLFECRELVRFVLGSGKRGRSYLISRNGQLFQSPIGWYAQSGQWDLSPGYSPHNHPRFSRLLGDGCLYCHAGRMHHREIEAGARAGRAADDHYEEPIFAEAAIGCERCHGPGERHVHFHSGTADAAFDDIVNPARLTPEKREAVCNQCHLLGQSVIPRCGRGFFDFRPGDALEDVFVVLSAPAPREGPMRAVSQVDQMRASRCFQGAGGALGCISCHDPHTTPAPEQRVEFYRNRCNRCHGPDGCAEDLATREQPPAKNSCIHCHMPAEATRDVPHTSLTDHRILRHAGQAAEKASGSGGLGGAPRPGEWTVFDDAEQRLPSAEVDRAKGIALMAIARERRDLQLATRAQTHLLNVLAPVAGEGRERLARVDDAPLLQELAAGYLLLQNLAAAEDCWKRLLELNPHDEAALTGLANAAEGRADRRAYRAYVDRLSAIRPDSEEVASMRVKLRFYEGEPAAAAEEAERALRLNPGLTELRTWLAGCYRRLGDLEKAAAHDELLERLPDRGNASER